MLTQGEDQRRRVLRAFSKAAYGARIDYQHDSAGLAGRSLRDSVGSRLGSRTLAGPRLTNLRNQIGNVSVALRKQVQTTQFSANGFLQKLGSRQTAFFDQTVQIVREIDLHTRHTPIYTPYRVKVKLPRAIAGLVASREAGAVIACSLLGGPVFMGAMSPP